MPRNKNIFKQVWEWLLNMGLLKASLVLNTVYYTVLGLLMWLLNWIDKHY